MNLMRADFYHIFHKKTFWILFIIVAAAACLFIGTSYGIEAGSLGKSAIGTASGLMDVMMLNIVGPVLAAFFICSDFQNKTIHDMVLQNGRKKIIWFKMVPYATIIGIILLPYTLLTLIGFISGGKFSTLFANSVDSSYMSLLANEAGYKVSAEVVLKLLLVLLVVALVYISRMSICVLLSVTLKKPVLVVFIGIVLELVLSLVATAGAESEIIRKTLDWTPFLLMRANNLSSSVPDLLRTGGTSLIFIAIILNITANIFSKSEVK